LPQRIDGSSTVVAALDCGDLLVRWRIDDSIHVEVVDVTSREISRQVQALRKSRGEDSVAARWLGERLLAGVDDPKRTLLLIAPHGKLRGIPYPVLSIDGRTLIDGFTTAMLPDCLSAVRPRPTPSAIGWVAFVDPDTDYDGDGMPDMDPLPGARKEGVEILVATLGSRLWAGEAASEGRMVRVAPEASLIHLGCHGSFFSHRPMESQLFLSPGDGGDGRLLAAELAQLPLEGCRLLVLSGCETALAASSGADDLAGFPRAALDAGVGAVLGSLWKVGDVATERFMSAFYSGLGDAADLPSAVRAARIACRSGSEVSSARHWSSWVLVENGWKWADNVGLDG